MKKFFSYNKEKIGSALALTMFIMAGMLIVALSGSYIILLGIKAGGIQSQSTKAYFAAESGAERMLWELRVNDWSLRDRATSTADSVFIDTLSTGANFKVYYTHFGPIIFKSIGEFNQTKRSVELKM